MSLSKTERAELGAKRCRLRFRTLEVLERSGLRTMAAVARSIGVSTVTVSRTLGGTLHSPRVLDALRDLGVPESYLCDPRRVGSAPAGQQ